MTIHLLIVILGPEEKAISPQERVLLLSRRPKYSPLELLLRSVVILELLTLQEGGFHLHNTEFERDLTLPHFFPLVGIVSGFIFYRTVVSCRAV